MRDSITQQINSGEGMLRHLTAYFVRIKAFVRLQQDDVEDFEILVDGEPIDRLTISFRNRTINLRSRNGR